MTDKPRKLLAKHGRRGAWVKAFLERGHELVRVQWKESNDPSDVSGTQSWDNTKENRAIALAWAEGKAEQLRNGGAAPKHVERTLREIWELFATANFPHLRPRSQQLYRENFRRWALTWGWEFIAEKTTLEMADEFRRQAKALGLATSTVRKTIYDVKMVFSWAEQRELMLRNKLRMYRFKVAKDDRPAPIAEYRGDEFGKIMGQLNPAWKMNWRPYVALGLCGLQGARQNAVLHLGIDDVRLGHHEVTADGLVWVPGEIVWRAEWDKLGQERKQPLRLPAQTLVEIALEWRERLGYDGPWLLPTGSRKSKRATYSAQSLWSALWRAESRAGVATLDRRAAHSLRRMLAGDVTAATGDFMLGLQAIGDHDPRMAARYIRTRQDRVADAFGRMDDAFGDLPANARNSKTHNPQPTRNPGENDAGASEEAPAQTTILQPLTNNDT